MIEAQSVGPCSVDDVAAAFVAAVDDLTAMKLEKLVYFAQATHLARYGTPLFEDEIQAWRDGPVVRRLYNQHTGMRGVDEWASGDPARLTATGQAVVDTVVRRYGDLGAEELSDITHRQAPWRLTRGDLPPEANSERPIPIELMRDFYTAQARVTEQAVSSIAASARLEGVELDSTTIGYLHALAEQRVSADEVVARLVAARA